MKPNLCCKQFMVAFSRRVARLLDCFVCIVSGEWVLKIPGLRANGGTVIFCRTIWVSLGIFGLAVAGHEVTDPESISQFSFESLQVSVHESLSWLGPIVAGVYAALYARFSSQWSYLAGIYYQIKHAEASAARDVVIVCMKAAYIEDAIDLHLARKPMFANAVLAWGRDSRVHSEFSKNCHGGSMRLDKLLRELGGEEE